MIELHEEKLVSLEVQQQDSKPPRKIYSLTERGRAALGKWILSVPEMPLLQNGLLMRLMWADQVEPNALQAMLANYADELEARLVLVREQTHRNHAAGEMTLASRAAAHFLAFYEREHEWVRDLLQTLEER